MSDNKPLQGIRVIDLTRLYPGPLCTQFLADLGAEVLKIESEDYPDYAKFVEPKKDKRSYFYLMVNRNKQPYVLNVEDKNDREVFYKLIQEADVIVESFRPGLTQKLKIDYETVKQYNSKIIYCSITGYGQEGPYSNKPGHDINYLSYAGILDQIGKKNGGPTVPNVQIADGAGAMISCIGILSAIISKQNGGDGRYIDISLMDSALSLSHIPFAHYQGYGKSPERGEDFLSGGTPSYNIYETKDGRHISLGAYEKKFWENFCNTIDRKDFIDKHLLTGEEGEKLYQEINEIFRTEDLAFWVEKFEEVEACVSPVLNFKEVENDEHIKQRQMIIDSKHINEGEMKQISCPIKMSDYTFEVVRDI